MSLFFSMITDNFSYCVQFAYDNRAVVSSDDENRREEKQKDEEEDDEEKEEKGVSLKVKLMVELKTRLKMKYRRSKVSKYHSYVNY